jgi:hypothetical protein
MESAAILKPEARKTMDGVVQSALWCPCGAAHVYALGHCRRCYDSQRHSLRRFGGRRDEVLGRDRYRCQNCGDAEILVHHRRPDDPASALITLCRRCHPRVHHRRRLYVGMPDLLIKLWWEQHRGQAEQLILPCFDLTAARSFVQESLFEAA